MIITPETSRISKIMIESGRCSCKDAEARLMAATLVIHVDPAYAGTPAAQAATLTAVVTGVRCFLGGVWLTGAVEQPLILPMRATTLAEAAVRLGARTGIRADAARRTVIIGSAPSGLTGWTVRAWWNNWSTGVRSVGDPSPPGCGRNSLAGIAAGALAVAQAFLAEQGDIQAGRSAHTLSLWSPGAADDPEPQRFYLPDALWLIGLGNLGQAYLWSLALLPYQKSEDLMLVLQDEDTIRDVNWGTSILVPYHRYGMLKTKMAEDWALERGFRVRRLDRFLDGSTLRYPGDPPIALSGLDRITARKLLGNVGFERVIDCGLGDTAASYRRFRLGVFDPAYTTAQHFDGVEDKSGREQNIRLKAYQEAMAEDPAAACGMAELAGASAAVPFVSMFVGTLAVAQAIRIASGQPHARSMVGSVDCVGAIRISPTPVMERPRAGYAEATDPDGISHSLLAPVGYRDKPLNVHLPGTS